MKRIVLGLMAALVLGGCGKGPSARISNLHGLYKPSNLQTFSETLTTSSKECISFNKQKMKTSVNFIGAVGDPDFDGLVKTINGYLSLSVSASAEYVAAIDQENSQVSQLEIIKNFKTSDNHEILFRQDFNYSDKDATKPFELSLSVSVNKPGEQVRRQVSQKYTVTAACKAELKSSVNTAFVQTDQTVKIEEKIISGNSTSLHTAEVHLGKNQNYLIDVDMFSFGQHEGDAYYLNMEQPSISVIPQANLMKEQMDPLDKTVKKISGQKWALFDGSLAFANIDTYMNPNSKFRFYIIGNLEFLTVGEEYWDTLEPSTAESLASQKVKLTKLKGKRPMTVTLSMDKSLNFSNMAVYWDKIEESQNLGVGLPYKYVLKNREINYSQDSQHLSPDLSSAQVADPNLRETYYLQTSLPQIQKISADLRENFDGTRLEMVKKILAVVGQNLTYDVDHKRGLSVSPVTTEEILKSRPGVCQHFANLFATIARSVGIPTRIISGFSLSADLLDAHVWNEVEIRAGVWIPVEPQFPTLSFDSATYLPMAVSTFFDSQNHSDLRAQEFKALRLTNFMIEN